MEIRYRMNRRAFTLVELLVVIGLIIILAAMLFPVFATAREAGRMASCQSNLKQIGAGILMYTQDYDELFPIPRNNGPVNAWGGLIQPYLRSTAVFRCPNMTDATVAGKSIWANNTLAPSNQVTFEAYGLNVDYLAPALPDATNWNKLCYESGPPTSLARISDTADLVMCVGISVHVGPGSRQGTNTLYPEGGGFCLAPAPATRTSKEISGHPQGGWGLNSYLGPFGGFEAPRHAGWGNVLFVDGHVRRMTPAQLAAGTNWTPNKPSTEITVTDPSRYLWRPQ